MGSNFQYFYVCRDSTHTTTNSTSQKNNNKQFECDLLPFSRARGPTPTPPKTPELMAARQAGWRRHREQEQERRRRRRRQKETKSGGGEEEGGGDSDDGDVLPPSLDDPDAFLPYLGVLRCLVLKRLDPGGYAELLAAPVRKGRQCVSQPVIMIVID